MAKRLVTIGCLRLRVSAVPCLSMGARTIAVFDVLKVHHGCGRREVVYLKRVKSLDHLSTCLLVSRLGNQGDLPSISPPLTILGYRVYTEVTPISDGNPVIPLGFLKRWYGFRHGNDAASQTMPEIWHSRIAMWCQKTVSEILDMANGTSEKVYALIQSVEVTGCAY